MKGERSVWLLRHAKAVVDPPPGGGDHERPLSAKGRRDANALGRRLGDDGDRLGQTSPPELVLSSTATRTRETAERVLADQSHPPPVTYLREIYEASPEDLVEVLRTVDDGVRSVMVVGHNPTMEMLASTLDRGTGGRRRSSRALPTCALALFAFDGAWRELALGGARRGELFVPPF
jgi:phosphohistidine phosphatase